jgi:hypothetical protein
MPLRLAALVLMSCLALAGCGVTSSQSATDAPTQTRTQGASTPKITSNLVTLTADRSTYAPGDIVRVTIANGWSVSVYALASKANCTALGVQVQGTAGWRELNISSCNSQVDPDTLEIKPGAATTVTITAPSAGMYRCALQYTTINIPPPRSAASNAIVSATTPANGPATTVYSAPWEVKSA